MKITYNLKIIGFLFLIICSQGCVTSTDSSIMVENDIIIGAARFSEYVPMLQNKSVGLVVNQTSVIGDRHLVDTLLAQHVNVVAAFAPEHGFRGMIDDGAEVLDEKDEKTGIPILSLYGDKRKPSAGDLSGINIMIFDMQDVGTRFYTFISTMHYVMEACAENDIPVIVLDRPNPNGHYVDGPMRKEGFESFVGVHPIPVVHGLTIGELAQMINGEGWLDSGSCNLTVIPVSNYTHATPYSITVKPSPNLPNDQAIRWYPSTCFFEGTIMSEGRGTEYPFLLIGYPDEGMGSFEFTPTSIPGMSTYPRFEDQKCFGIDLREVPPPDRIDLSHLIKFYTRFPEKESFFIDYFNLLAGNDLLRAQIENGESEEAIRASWQDDLSGYKILRNKYLLYPDF